MKTRIKSKRLSTTHLGKPHQTNCPQLSCDVVLFYFFLFLHTPSKSDPNKINKNQTNSELKIRGGGRRKDKERHTEEKKVVSE